MIAALHERELIKEASKFLPEACSECGLCSYVCPSNIPPRHGRFTVFYNLETPVFFTPSHVTATNTLLLVLPALSVAAGFVTEYIGVAVTKNFTGYYGFSVWILFPLLTPPGMPLWMSALCLSLSLAITVILFGGFGHHLFHPAVTAQIFIMINFAVPFKSGFLRPFIVPEYGWSVWSALLGAGLVFLAAGGVNRKTPVAFFLTYLLAALAGSALFYGFFIFSDRLTSAKSNTGRIIAGCTAALLAVLMRAFSSKIESLTFAALAFFAFTPLFDEFGFFLKHRLSRR